jgi:hypothetical protein
MHSRTDWKMPARRAFEERLAGAVQEAVDQLRGIVGRGKGVDQLGDIRCGDAADQVLLRREERAHEVDRLDAHDLVVLPLAVADAHLGQRLQRRAEAAADRPRAVRPPLALAVIGREEHDHLVALPRGKGVQDDGLGALDSHRGVVSS